MRVPASVSIGDVQQAFRDVWAVLGPFAETRPIDWTGRRLSEVGDAEEDADAITKHQVEGLLSTLRADAGLDVQPTQPGALQVVSGRVRVGPLASRGVATAHKGDLFLASDRNYVAWVSDGTAWKYASGIQYGTLSPDQKPTLTTDDVGYRFRSTDFAREYRWSGSAWADAPGQPDRGQIVHFTDGTGITPGTGWYICDGTAGVTRSTATGGTTTVTVPDLTTDHRFIRSTAGPTGGTGGSATTHTHSVDPPNTTSGNNSAAQEVQSGTGVTVAAHTHTHDTNIGSFTSGAPSGSSGDDALPPYMYQRPYIRL